MNNIGFRGWLKQNTTYSDRVIKDTVCRMHRAEKIISVNGKLPADAVQKLISSESYRQFSPTVKSQCKKALNLYLKYIESEGKQL